MLKVNLFASECSDYQNVQSLKRELKTDPGFYSRCAAILGPNQPGITQADPSYTGAQNVAEKAAPVKPPARKRPARRAPDTGKPAPPRVDPSTPKKEVAEVRHKAQRLKKKLEDTLGIHLPRTPALPRVPALPNGATAPDPQQLLDYLLGP
jgi:hypothetical protein